jgi:hypothetical protein
LGAAVHGACCWRDHVRRRYRYPRPTRDKRQWIVSLTDDHLIVLISMEDIMNHIIHDAVLITVLIMHSITMTQI